MRAKGFSNVRDQIGFCGIYCGSCVAGNGALLELTRRYEETAKKYNLEKWAPKDFNFNEFAKGLASIQTMSLCIGRKKGGGSPKCSIKLCASGRNVSDCSECHELMQCRNFEEMGKNYPEIRQSLLEIKNVDRRELIQKWTSELKTRWSHCILACASPQ